MKKTKIITISILGMLLLVPFMMPTKAAPASYVGVTEEAQYAWIMYINYGNFATWDADNMTGAFNTIFSTDDWGYTIAGQVRSDWTDIQTAPQAFWPITILDILPEATDDFLLANFIPDNITHTDLNVTWGYDYWAGPITWADTWTIVNDTVAFAKHSLFGGMAASPYWVMGVQLGPKNINWATFTGVANWGIGGGYWTDPLAANTTVNEEVSGYSMTVPAEGYAKANQFNNTQPITINVSYSTDGVLQSYTLHYGASLLYGYYYYAAESYTDVIAPVTSSPGDITVDYTYSGESINWTATDANAGNYTITFDGTPVVTTTPWVNGTQVTYNIPDGLAPGAHTYVITFSDAYSNSVGDSVLMTITVPDSTDPVITVTPSDLTLAPDYTGQSLSWTATDAYAVSYSIKRNGSLVIVNAAPWTSGTPVTYDIPDGYPTSVTTYEITFTDINGNTATDSVTVTVEATSDAPAIPGFEPLIVIGIATIVSIGLIALKKKKK